jgi:hypothetical protein
MVGQSFFRCRVLLLAAASLSVAAFVARASGDAVLSFASAAADSQQPQISVRGAAGRYNRVDGSTIRLPLVLKAAFDEDAGSRKIMSSVLVLRQEGGSQNTDVFDGSRPVASLSMAKTFDFRIDPLGPVAQNAIAACNALSPAKRASSGGVDLSVPIVWRVRTGRFNFQWTNYDRVGPSDEILSNPDFYSDVNVVETEAMASVRVDCEDASSGTASQSKIVSRAKPAAIAAVPAPAEREVRPSTETPVKMQTVTVAASAEPTCTGGMVRQVGSGDYLCLCPGNTVRVASGDNAFACERKWRRR